MKKTSFVFSMVLVIMSSLTSCFKTSGLNNAYFCCNGTLYGSYASGYTILSDDGIILIPTNESINRALPALTKPNNVRRVFIAFNVVGEDQPEELIPGQEYDINIADTGENYGGPAEDLINLYQNPAAADTLVTNPHPLPLATVEGAPRSWVANGYVNLYTFFMYNYSIPFYMDLSYDSSCDIDRDNNEVTLTLHLTSTATVTNQTAYALLHFRLPDDLQAKLKADKDVTFHIRGVLDTTFKVKDIVSVKCDYDDVKESSLFRN